MTINPKSLTIEVIHNDTIIVTSPTILPCPRDSSVHFQFPPSGQRGWLSLHQRWRSLLSIMRRPPTPSAPSRSLRSTNVDDLCRRPALTIYAVDTAPSTDVKRSLTLLQTTSARRPPAMSSVWYLSVARSPLIYYPTAQATMKGHHVFLSFAGHTCSRLSDNGRSPVIQRVQCVRCIRCSLRQVTLASCFI